MRTGPQLPRGSIPVPTQADEGQRRLTRVMVVASDFRELRPVAYCRGTPGVAYESVALPLSYPGGRLILHQLRWPLCLRSSRRHPAGPARHPTCRTASSIPTPRRSRSTTPPTRARRRTVRTGYERAGFQVLFIEIRCDDPHIIEVNIRSTKRSSPEVAEELTYSRSPLPRARSTRASWSRSPSASRTCIPISSSL